MPRVVEIPVQSFETVALRHLSEDRGAGVWRQNVKSRRGDSALDCPVDSAGEDVAIVPIQAKNKTAIDHDPEAIQPAADFAITAAKVLTFAGAPQTASRERFEPYEQTS